MLKKLVILLMLVGIGGETFQTNFIELYYRLNTAAITQEYCINKDKPQMHCNGQCHLAKQLKKATQPESSNSSNNKSFKLIDLFANTYNCYTYTPLQVQQKYYIVKSAFIPTGYYNLCFHPPTICA
ncbi:hypothetical protein [Hydrotalea sp.]|uniref:hypothetical protein n=1 Tax=Hydrotalea sp. TaxID=2881279 RepID=UPI003D0BCF04